MLASTLQGHAITAADTGKKLDKGVKKQIKSASSRLQKQLGKIRMDRVTEGDIAQLKEAKQTLQEAMDHVME